MRLSTLFTLSLLVLSLLCLLSPSLSSPPSNFTSSLNSTSHHNNRSDPYHDHEESIENAGQQRAQSMQDQYRQQQEQQQEQSKGKHSKPNAVDRNATVVTGDDLRHSRDPNQQKRQQEEVIKSGQKEEPRAAQTDDRRDDEDEKAKQAESIASDNQPPATVNVDDDEEEKEEDEEVTEKGERTHPLYNSTSSRFNQTSPYHTDPQARTWSHQQQPRPTSSNSTSSSNSSSYQPSQLNHSSPLTDPLPVPTVDHAQSLVARNQSAPSAQSGRYNITGQASDSGSDADDEYDEEDEYPDEASEPGVTSTGTIQDPGNAVEMDGVKGLKAGGWGVGWMVLMVLVMTGAFGGGYWLRKKQQQHAYERVDSKEFDAYGDLMDDEEKEEATPVQVRVY